MLTSRESVIAECMAALPPTAADPNESPSARVRFDIIMECAKALAALKGGTRATPAPAKPEWQWWSGNNDEYYSGPFDTRAEAIEAALETYGIDPNDPADAGKSIHVVEAVKEELRLGPFIDLATYVSDRLEDGGALAEYQNEEGDPLTEKVTDPQWKDLQTRFEALVDQWQADHSIVLIPWRFDQTRNREEIFPAANAQPPAPEASTAPAPDAGAAP